MMNGNKVYAGNTDQLSHLHDMNKTVSSLT